MIPRREGKRDRSSGRGPRFLLKAEGVVNGHPETPKEAEIRGEPEGGPRGVGKGHRICSSGQAEPTQNPDVGHEGDVTAGLLAEAGPSSPQEGLPQDTRGPVLEKAGKWSCSLPCPLPLHHHQQRRQTTDLRGTLI